MLAPRNIPTATASRRVESRLTAKKEGDGRAYNDCVMHKIQYFICNIFATTVDTQDQTTEPNRQCPTEHTNTNPTATPNTSKKVVQSCRNYVSQSPSV